MNKKWLRRILAMAMVFSLAAGSWVTGYADDGEGNIVISGDGVYEVEAGKTTKTFSRECLRALRRFA